TAPGILKKIAYETKKSQSPLPAEEQAEYIAGIGYTHQQLEHLIEALGVLRYRPAAPLLKRYLPDPPEGRCSFPHRAVWQHNLRAAAVWSLGHLFAADVQAEWVNALRDVLVSIRNAGEPDGQVVRAMAAVGLGRMEAPGVAALLRLRCEEPQ